MRATTSAMIVATTVGCLSAAACRDFTISLNERMIYEPPRLFTDFSVDDARLQICIEQAIMDQAVELARELVNLSCTNAGISSLTGIEIFTGLQSIDLDDNEITDLQPLQHLPALQMLHLRNNRIRSIDPLLCSMNLREIAIAGNRTLDCSELPHLTRCGITVSDPPEHCIAANPVSEPRPD